MHTLVSLFLLWGVSFAFQLPGIIVVMWNRHEHRLCWMSMGILLIELMSTGTRRKNGTNTHKSTTRYVRVLVAVVGGMCLCPLQRSARVPETCYKWHGQIHPPTDEGKQEKL